MSTKRHIPAHDFRNSFAELQHIHSFIYTLFILYDISVQYSVSSVQKKKTNVLYVSATLNTEHCFATARKTCSTLLKEGLFPLDRESLLYDFEERLAIAEYDGDQTALHAHRIAYLDAFISVLTSLPETGHQRDGLDQRIQTSLAWIEAQGLYSIN